MNFSIRRNRWKPIPVFPNVSFLFFLVEFRNNFLMFLDQNMVRVIHPETQNIYLIDSKEFSRELEQNGTILTEETIPCTAVQPQPVKHDMDSQSLKLPKIEIKKIFW